MIELLLKIFVKDYKNTANERVRTNYGLLGAWFGIVSNLLLFAGKITVGLLIGNLSIVADALNNLSDLGNCFLAVFGFRMSSKPADAEHPFGHQRMEYIISMIISIVIIALGINIIYQAVLSLINPEPAMTDFNLFLISACILGASMLVKVLQSAVYFALGKRIDSLTLKANGADARNDVLATGAVLIGLIVSYYTGFTRVDGILTIIVGLFILYAGIKILHQTADVLLGEKPSQETINAFTKIVTADPNVLGIHDLEMHCYGPSAIFASVHCEVDGSKNIFASHDMIDNIETECYKKLHIKTVIHMDPVKVNDPETDRCRKIVEEAVRETDKSLNIHDFRIVSGPTHINAVFDMVVPFELKKNVKALTKTIRAKVKEKDPKINPVISYDDQYAEILSGDSEQ